MPRKPKRLQAITFDWMIPAEERRQVEDFMSTLGYVVDGGGTMPETGTAVIYVSPKHRSHKRKSPPQPSES